MMESVDEGKVRDRDRHRPEDADTAAASVKAKGKGKAEDEDEEFLGIKLRRGVLAGKRCGGTNTPPPTWSFPDQINRFPSPVTAAAPSSSARQLGANLWEMLPHLSSMEKIEKGSGGGGSRRYQYGGGGLKKKGLFIQPVLEEEDEEENLTDSDVGTDEQQQQQQQPGSAGSSFHRQIAESLRRHHRSVAQNSRALQPVSPASFSSSMEVTPYNPAGTPTSSIELKIGGGGGGRNNDPNYSLKTSTELLKVLNRIWSLEEQHASNLSLVKSLKSELNSSRMIIKELLKEKQVDRQVIDNLMKQVSSDDNKRKNNTTELDRVRSALQSVKEELEDERRLRKRSESLHRKLGRELSEVKSAVNKAVSEVERERRGRVMLEDLCDEFAMCVREYEQEMRLLSSSKQKDHHHLVRAVVGDSSLILQVSEAWLDERMQMKMEQVGSEREEEPARKSMVVEKLSSEIEAFLQARHQQSVVNCNKKVEDDYLPTKEYSKEQQHCFRRQSLESFPLNEAGSAPQNLDDDDDDSVDSESNCFELSKMVSGHHGADGLLLVQGQNGGDSSQRSVNNLVNNSEQLKRSVEPQEVKNGVGGTASGMSRMQARFEQHMARTILSSQGKTTQSAKSSTATTTTNPRPPPAEMSTTSTFTTQKSEEISGGGGGGSKERKSKRFGSSLMGSILSNNSSSLEGEKIHPEDTLVGDELLPLGHKHFMSAGPASPVKKWESRMGRLRGGEGEPEMMMESAASTSTRWVSKGLKENTLKAKLMEARLEGRNHHHHQSPGI